MIQTSENRHTFTAIDLFSGAGGLSVGLEQAGFNVVAAVENNHVAADTYRYNHKSTRLIEDDIRNITPQMLWTNNNHINLIAGCPPCQGFSSLTNKYKNEDPRNMLALEMLRLVKEMKPDIVMLENVPGLATKGKTIFTEFIAGLEDTGYIVTYAVLQVADFGVPQTRKRLVLLAGRGFEIPIPKGTHSINGQAGTQRWCTVRDAIQGITAPITFLEARKSGGPIAYNWNVIRNISEDNKKRLQYLKAGESRIKLPDSLRPKCHKGIDNGYSNVYGRLQWDKPSVTITAGCTTLSKGRFGHPDECRTISVLEAAKIQTFPDNYVFYTERIDEVCRMIGNALPCLFAEKISYHCLQIYKRHLNIE